MAPCWPKARWASCATVLRLWRPTLSADLSNKVSTGHKRAGATLCTVGLTAGYGGRPVVHGVSINVEPGRVVSIVGPNGSGKSTMLKSFVDLPLPLGPTMDTTRPGSTLMETPWTTGRPP